MAQELSRRQALIIPVSSSSLTRRSAPVCTRSASPASAGPGRSHIKGLPGAESRARAAGLSADPVRRRSRGPGASREAASEAAGVRAVVVAQIVVLCARPSRREHRFDDQIKDLFLAEVTSAVIIRGPALPPAAGRTATASVCPAAAAVYAACLRLPQTQTLRLTRATSPFG